MPENGQKTKKVTSYERDREEAGTHAGDIVAVISAQANLSEFRKGFGAQFGHDTPLRVRTYDIIRDYFGDESRLGVVLYGESLVASLPAGESVRELAAELRRAQRLVSSLVLE